MNRSVPFLPKEAIELNAEALLAEFEEERGFILKPPIPIDDIVEKHLKLRLEIEDLHVRFDIPRRGLGIEPDILGAIFGDGTVLIDTSLDPEVNPSMEGRYRFTLAHEAGGHWRLHQFLLNPEVDHQRSLISASAEPRILCRETAHRAREEWQADFYASCLLMPRRLIFNAWRRRFGHREPFVFAEQCRFAKWLPPRSNWTTPSEAGQRAMLRTMDARLADSHDYAFDKIAAIFAEDFCVSLKAMRIRLEHLELLLVHRPAQAAFQGVG